MKNKPNQPVITAHAIDLHYDVERWLIHDNGFYVGLMEGGRLLFYENGLFAEFRNFRHMANTGMDDIIDPPPEVLLAVAHALGITHVTRNGKRRDVETYFASAPQP